MGEGGGRVMRHERRLSPARSIPSARPALGRIVSGIGPPAENDMPRATRPRFAPLTLLVALLAPVAARAQAATPAPVASDSRHVRAGVRLRDFLPAKAPPGTRELRDLEYAKVGDRVLHIDLYLPEKADAPVPVVVWIHGGGWEAGGKSPCPAVPFVAHGYAVASVQYRFSSAAPFPAQLHDCKGAIRWLRAHASEHHLDPTRIGVWGHSAGGHLAALLGTSAGVAALEGDVGGNPEHSSAVQAVCDASGPTDLLVLNGDRPETPITHLLGGTIAAKRDLAVHANPITHVDPTDAPCLLMHGEKDNLVPTAQAELLARALEAKGVPVRVRIIEGAGHVYGGADVLKQVREFFDERLRAPAPTSTPTPASPSASK
jgi:acetyl esterase/lipase